MRYLKILVPASAALIAFVLAIGPMRSAEPPAAPAAAAVKIGVVDLPIVFQKYSKCIEFDKKIKDMTDSMQKELDARKKEIDNMKLDLGTLLPESDKYKKLLQDIAEKTSRYKEYREVAAGSIEKKATEASRDSLSMITEAVKKYGRANGYSVIFKSDTLPFTDDFLTMRAQLGQRSVLYYADGLDVTEDVLKLLNSAGIKEEKKGEEKE